MPINSRAKGAAGEREWIAELAPWLGDWVKQQVKRNLDQTREGGHDIVGLGNWAPEIKRYRSCTESDIRGWWEQAVEQAKTRSKLPALAYRVDYRPWRVRVPMAHLCGPEGIPDGVYCHIDWTAEVGMESFCHLVRESMDVPVS